MQRVAALDARAESLGLRPGLSVAEARAMRPGVEVVEADPAADRRLLEALADWCDRYTPLVALDGNDGLFLDIAGCCHLFGGERALLDDALARLWRQGFGARAAIASTPGAAWAAARYASGSIVGPDLEMDFLAPLPLASLRLDPAIRHGLESVGLRVAGAIMNTPRAPLVRRFGRAVTLRIDQALGRIEEAVSPRLAMPTLIVERHFSEPIALLDDIESLIAVLSRQLKIGLERRGEGAEKLQLQLFHADGDVSRIAVAASRPLRDPMLIQKLFHEKLAGAMPDINAGYGFDLVRLAVMAAARFDDTQTSLGEVEADREGCIALFADRVRARLGDRSVSIPRIIESHWPECAATLVSGTLAPCDAWRYSCWGETTRRSDAAPSSKLSASFLLEASRPIRLLEAEQIEVTAAEIPEGPPGRFRWRGVSYRVVGAEGPERIAPEWWQATETAGTRDYFRVEDGDGRRYWLYCEGRYGAQRPPRWFMQGMFA